MNTANINGDKLMYYPERVSGDYRPITADIFLDNYCNNQCPYCVYQRWELESGARSMTYDDFVRYAERMLSLGVRGFILTGGGEPTISKDFDSITNWLEDHSVHYGINTNFNLLKLFKPDYMKVSLDGWDEESYEDCRGVKAYTKVRQNIIAYDDWRRINSAHTTLGIQKVVAKAEEVFLFYEGNKDLPVDYIAFRPMESTCGSFYDTQSNFSEVEKIITNILEIGKTDKRVSMSFKWNLLGEKFSSCHAHWAQLAINERGQVMYCCHKPYQIIGHIMDADILKKCKAAQTDMNTCDVPCRLTAPNRYVRMLQEGTKDPYFL